MSATATSDELPAGYRQGLVDEEPGRAVAADAARALPHG